MTSITATSSLLTELGSLKEVTEIRTPDGAVLGIFAPAAGSSENLYREAARNIDPAEVQRRKQNRQPGYSIEEVLSQLRSLEAGS